MALNQSGIQATNIDPERPVYKVNMRYLTNKQLEIVSTTSLLSSLFDMRNFTVKNHTLNVNDIDLLCRGFGGRDYANLSNIGVACGMVMYKHYCKAQR